MHQTNVGMQGNGQRLTRHTGPSMGQRHRVFLMQAKQQFGSGVAQVIHQTVVQAAKARARSQRNVGIAKVSQQERDGVAAKCLPCGGRLCTGNVDAHYFSLLAAWRAGALVSSARQA